MKVKDSFVVGNYTVVSFDEPLPIGFKQAIVNGEICRVIPAYDCQNSIAILGNFNAMSANIQLI